MGPLITKKDKWGNGKNEDLQEGKESEEDKHIEEDKQFGVVRCFGQIMRMDNSRITKQTFNHVYERKHGSQQIQDVKKDMHEMI